MIDLLEKAPEMSVADRSFASEEEVYTMTSYGISVRRARPHGVDRLIMRVSLMMLLAARRHAEATAVTYDEHTRLHEAAKALRAREHDAARLTVRGF